MLTAENNIDRRSDMILCFRKRAPLEMTSNTLKLQKTVSGYFRVSVKLQINTVNPFLIQTRPPAGQGSLKLGIGVRCCSFWVSQNGTVQTVCKYFVLSPYNGDSTSNSDTGSRIQIQTHTDTCGCERSSPVSLQTSLDEMMKKLRSADPLFVK